MQIAPHVPVVKEKAPKVNRPSLTFCTVMQEGQADTYQRIGRRWMLTTHQSPPYLSFSGNSLLRIFFYHSHKLLSIYYYYNILCIPKDFIIFLYVLSYFQRIIYFNKLLSYLHFLFD